MRALAVVIYVVVLFAAQSMYAQGKVSVLVTTNVNNFTCECGESDFIYKETANTLDKNLKILFPLVAFECPKKLMEKDLQELFESEHFPYAKLTVVTFDVTAKKVVIQLSLKDVTREYTLYLDKTKLSNKNYLKGVQTIRLKDYNVVPPTKMMGLVKVYDEVKISFLIPEEQMTLR